MGDPARRFQVYRNNVVASLIDALADTFPVTSNWWGRLLQGDGRRFRPWLSTTFADLAFYGDDFPDFIPAASRLPPV